MRFGEMRNIVKDALERAGIIARFLCCVHVTNNYLISTTHAHGVSMLPTLNPSGDVLIVDRKSPRLGTLQVGDLVLVQSPLNPKRVLTKRLLAMEGDAVTYFDPLRGDTTLTAVVPKGHAWIQGDNLYYSTDSRYFGPVPYGLIQGKLIFRVWPIDGFGSLGH